MGSHRWLNHVRNRITSSFSFHHHPENSTRQCYLNGHRRVLTHDRSWLQDGVGAALAVGVATLLRLLLTPVQGNIAPTPLFVLAIMVSAWYGGIRPALLATLLSTIAINFFWQPPAWQLRFDDPINVLVLFQFVLVGVAISCLSEQLHKAKRQAQANAQEVSSQKNALEQSQERLQLALLGADLGMWDYDLISGKLNWTKRCKTMFGLAPDTEISYEVFENALHPEDREKVSLAVEESIAHQKFYDIEYRSLWADGTLRWIAAKGRAFYNTQSKAIRMVGVVQDITDRKQVEAALRKQTEALEQANRFKDDFIAVVSHELKSPLNSILGWAQILRQRSPDKVMLSRGLETIERNARSQNKLITDLLEVSRLIRGKMRLHQIPVNLASIAQNSIEAMKPTAQAKQIQLLSHISSDVGQVLGDPERLQQVIWNLLSNAIKFTNSGGKVEICLKRVDSIASIKVSDTGQGISPDFLPYVFEQFRQEDNSATRMQGGLGLGLAIVRQLVELHGGSVGVESPGVGLGATFTVKLPLLQGSRESGVGNRESPHSLLPTPNSPSSLLKGLRVLVVDDDTDTRELFITCLKEEEAEVIAATNAAEAFTAFIRFQPDVLISDIGMPEENGYSLIRKIRGLDPERGGRVQALAVTGYATEKDQRQAIEAGFQKHLAKPIITDELVAAIAKLTHRSITLDG